MTGTFQQTVNFRWHPACGELDLFADLRVTLQFLASRIERRWRLDADIDVLAADCRGIEIRRDRTPIARLEPWTTPCELLARDFLQDARHGQNGLKEELFQSLLSQLHDLDSSERPALTLVD